MIANIYMHYVLLWWFKEKIQPLLKGFSGAVVYADDFVMSFQYKSDAELDYELLKKRMKHFGLSLEENQIIHDQSSRLHVDIIFCFALR